MHRTALLVLLLAACAAPPASPPAPDAGTGGSACDGGLEGPLGGCIPAKGPCDECATSGDCPADQTCSDFGGCRLCAHVTSGSVCAVQRCLSGNECCPGSSCVQPDDPPPCGGACFRGEDACSPDGPEGGPCPPGNTCEPVTERCSCGPAVMKCVPHCPTNPCADDQTCVDGTCVPKKCPEVACGTDQVCVGTGGDARGCAPKPCVKHEDCAKGFCFAGACRRATGTCEFPRP